MQVGPPPHKWRPPASQDRPDQYGGDCRQEGGGRLRAGRGRDALLGGGQRERGRRAKPKAGDLRAGPADHAGAGRDPKIPGARCKGSALAVTSTARHNGASGARVLGCLFIGSRRFATWCCCPAVFLFRSLRPAVDPGGGRPNGRGGVPLGRRPWGRRCWGRGVWGAGHAGSGCRTASPWAVAAAGGQHVTAHLAVVDAVAGDLPAVIDL
jgi:hypothetical protein